MVTNWAQSYGSERYVARLINIITEGPPAIVIIIKTIMIVKG